MNDVDIKIEKKEEKKRRILHFFCSGREKENRIDSCGSMTGDG
jgi:hypothetical protein